MLNTKNRPTILKPLINEKTMKLLPTGFYTFIVDTDSNKDDITKAISEMFKVSVINVKTMKSTPIRKMQRARRKYYLTKPVKKAVVQLKKGDKIALFEQGSGSEEVTVETVEGEKVATVKEKKSLLKGTKVKIEKTDEPKKGKKD